jgi:secreted trypsin-like serine protease
MPSKKLTTSLATLALAAGFSTPAQAIVNGNDASPGEYPYVAKITIDKAFGCTGTLVDPTHVVTAGHCTSLVPGGIANVPIGQPGQLIEVNIGAYKAPFRDGEAFTATKVDVAPKYLGVRSVRDDVSVLTLNRPSSATPVKIASAAERDSWKAGTIATIAGYGTTESGGDTPNILQEATVPIRSDADTAAAYEYFVRGVDALFGGFESQSQLGAGNGTADTCQGDSGGPLLVDVSGAKRLVGDTSYGVGCNDPEYPGVYGRVADTYLREWIRSVAPDAIAPTTTTTTTTTTTPTTGTKTKGPKSQTSTSTSDGSGKQRTLR